MEPETVAKLDKMARDAGYDNRSAFVRWLIREEYNRRYQQTAQTAQSSTTPAQ
jgi:metal-responsive CopG/Arc/MetJ family transcriptional regulator